MLVALLADDADVAEDADPADEAYPADDAEFEPLEEDEDAGEMTETIVETPPKAAAPKPPLQKGQTMDSLFWNQGPLDFNLSSGGLIVVGKTNSAKELNAFIEKLKALTVLLPEDSNDEAS